MVLPASAQVEAAEPNSETTNQLAEQARYWESRNRYDLAYDSWVKLLNVIPDDPEALKGAAVAEALSGNTEEAENYLRQLKRTSPGYAGIAEVEDALRSNYYKASDLETPRKLAGQGEYDAAIAAYQEVFGGHVPSGRLGLEYYQTLAGVDGGWEPARAGMQSLVQDYPGDPIYRLALAQHLTYNADTRRQGIRQLETLTGDPATADMVQPALKQALLWLDAKPQDEPLYQVYLNRYGQDSQVSAVIARVKSANVTAAQTPAQIRGLRVRAAFELLDGGELSKASEAFQAILEGFPQEDAALGGLGITRLRQQRYSDARELLEQATAAAPGGAARWKEALASATFWEQIELAQIARKGGQLDEAESLLRAAIKKDPTIARSEPSVTVALADILVEQSEYREAETLYREVLKRNPSDTGAARGLVGLMSSTGRLDEAMAMIQDMSAEQQAEIGGLGALKGYALRQEADAALKGGDAVRAESLLKQALLEDPESPWTRLDLARIYQEQHRYREANTLVDGLLTGGRNMPDALHIKAMLLAEQQQWYDGLLALERIPPGSRTADMQELQQRLWIRYEAERAGVFARYGRVQEATATLESLEPYAKSSDEVLSVLAGGWADLGQEERALNYMRQALGRTADPDVGLRLQYAGLLFRLRQDAECEVVMQDLLRRQDLTPKQSLDLASLRVAYQLRQADLVREEGNLARAFEYLKPLLQANPNDPRVLMSLSRLYNDSGDFQQTLALNRRVLQIDAENLDAYKGAIGAALALNDLELAESYLDQAMKLEPHSGRLYAYAARIAQARGQEGRALELYQQALILDQKQPAMGESGGAPFRPELRLINPATSPVYSSSALQGAASPGAEDVVVPAAADNTAATAVTLVATRPDEPFHRTIFRAPAPQVASLGEDSLRVLHASRLLRDQVQAGDERMAGRAGFDPSVIDPALRTVQAQTRSSQPAPSAPPAPPPPPAPTIYPYLQLPSPPYQAVPTQQAPPALQRRSQSATNEILQEIAQLKAQRSPSVTFGVSYRNRDGASGLDQLNDLETPVELSLAAPGSGRFKLRAVPVHLDAGELAGEELERFGTLVLADQPGAAYSQDATGVALGAAYEQASFEGDFGTSPLGFDVETLVGGMTWRPTTGPWSFKLDLSRRSVTDSLLSYAGAYDPRLQSYWGGITKNGGRLDAAYDLGGAGVYGNIGYHVLDGRNVDQNNVLEAGGGVYARAYETRRSQVTYGVNVTTFFYDENLRRFTYGHGGYFSPQSYFSVAVPVEWSGSNARLAYRVNGAIGVQTFEEDSVAVFPTESRLQNRLERFAADNPEDEIVTYYPSQNSTGLGLNLGGVVEYLATPNLILGTKIGFSNARDYDEASMLGYVRFLFYPQRRITPPPTPVSAYYNYGDPTE